MRFAAGRNLLLTAVGADPQSASKTCGSADVFDATIGSANAGHSQSLVLQGLRLTPATIDATPTVRIRAAAGTQSTHSVTLYQSHIVLEPATSAVARAAVRMESFYGGSATLSLQENRIMAASGGVALIADSSGARACMSSAIESGASVRQHRLHRPVHRHGPDGTRFDRARASKTRFSASAWVLRRLPGMPA